VTAASVAPATIDDLQAAVRDSAQVAVRGGGSKRLLTGLPPAATILDMRRLTGITEYTPAECVVTARAGTPLATLEAALAREGHYLPFDPPFAAAGATLGGAVAAGLSGSGRLRYGGLRDFITGVRLVDGEGRLIRSGGQVVKNAAGFLLHHAVVGSVGRFGAIAEVSLKVFPLPSARLTLRADLGSMAEACAAMLRARDARVDLEALDLEPPGTLWLRLAGPAATLDARAARVQAALGGGAARLDGDAEAAPWHGARAFAWADPGAGHALVRAPITPHDVARLEAELGPTGVARRYTCGAALAWIAWPLDALDALAVRLAAAGVTGQVARGTALAPLGGWRLDPFHARLRDVLDPRRTFV
jgi:glycolate oxidase FAD binding subunit